jgi:Holliday junction resolvasome RuvABC endonuclease subunit
VKILGLDQGFSNFGWCLATYENEMLTVDDMGMICTQKSKLKVPMSEDNSRRTRHIVSCVEALVLKFDVEDQRTRVTVDCICSEAMSHPPSASVATKLGRVWGIVDTLSYMTKLPVLHRSPADIKLAVTGSRKASKALMVESLAQAYPEIRPLLAPWPKGKHEHMVDALGAVVACLDDNVVKMGTRR